MKIIYSEKLVMQHYFNFACEICQYLLVLNSCFFEGAKKGSFFKVYGISSSVHVDLPESEDIRSTKCTDLPV